MGKAARQRIVGLGLAVAVLVLVISCGSLATYLIGSVRSQTLAAADLSALRGDFAGLVSYREMIEAGDDVSREDVDALSTRVLADLPALVDVLATTDPVLAAQLEAAVQEYVGIVQRSVRSNDDEAIEAIDDTADAYAWSATQALVDGRRVLDGEAATAHRWALTGLWLSVVFAAMAALIALEGVGRASRRAQRAESGRRADDRIRALIEHAPDIVAILAPDGTTVRYASPAVTSVLGYDRAAVPSVSTLIHPDDARALQQAFAHVVREPDRVRRVEARFRHARGDWRHLDMSLSNRIDDPDVDGVVVNARDISDRVDLERSLSHQARHDPLTGLANRASFVDLVHRELVEATDEAVSIVFLDLDGFKEINDSLGHGAGDEVLMTVAARLLTLTRHRDHVARLGGDEFALAVVGDAPGPIAERLLTVVAEPIELGVGSVQVGASVGIATAGSTSTVDELLRDADVAMYDAKARGKNRVSSFEPEMHDSLIEKLAMRAAVDHGMAAGEFRLAYQPELSLADGRLLGFEALLRWDRADGTVTQPDDFIPLTESTGQIVPLGRWVLHEALRQLVMWQQAFGMPQLTMAVNISARQLVEDDFVDEVAGALQRAGVDPSTLTLELTESTVVHDLGVANRCFDELRRLGVRLAVDDYGAGHASIGYLREFPIDILKIDRSFVWALDTDAAEAHAYLRSITDLAAALSIDTIAEGIEHSHQLESLRSLGCTFGQGYHLARPLDVEAAAAFIRAEVDRTAGPTCPDTDQDNAASAAS